MKNKVLFNWSGGKDSALGLYKLLKSDEFEVVSLLTTANSITKRSSMHGIPAGLLHEQAKSIGIPLYLIEYAPEEEMKGYEESMSKAVELFREQGVNYFAFGDIFLHDIRSYREGKLNPHKIEVLEPLWNLNTRFTTLWEIH